MGTTAYTHIKGTLLNKAITLAVTAHANQFDKGGRPYILHPLTVMHRLRTDDEELQCIAVLHDVVEDTACTIDNLSVAGMTLRVVRGIDDLTKYPHTSYEEYKARVLSNPDAMRVKLEDLRHNSDIRRLKGLRPKDMERIAKYHAFYLEIAAALKCS